MCCTELSCPHRDAAKCGLMCGVHVWLCHPLSTLAQSPGDSPGVGGM